MNIPYEYPYCQRIAVAAALETEIGEKYIDAVLTNGRYEQDGLAATCEWNGTRYTARNPHIFGHPQWVLIARHE